MGAYLSVVGLLALVLTGVGWLWVAALRDRDNADRRAAAAWRSSLWALVPLAAAVLAVLATVVLREIPTYDCAVDRDAPGPPPGAVNASMALLLLGVGCVPIGLAAAAVTARLRTAPDDTRRYVAYLVSGATTWLAGRLAWLLIALGALALARFPEVVSYC